jgi:predicted DNA-binding transcriptional regulator AlpA
MDDDAVRAANAKKGSPFLNTDQAAHYVGLSRQALEKMRRRGVGPRYRKHGRYVRYHIVDLDAWSDSCSRNATREADGQPPVKRGEGGESDA